MLNFRSTRLINQLSTIFFSLFILGACNNSNEPCQYISFTIQGKTQGTTYTIIGDQEKLITLQKEIDAILLDFDRCLSSYRDSSIVSMISNADTGLHIYRDINNYFVRCFDESVRVYRLSQGAFDPSVFPLVAAWGFMKDPALVMSETQVDSVLGLIGFQSGVDYKLDLLEDDKHSLTKFGIHKLRKTLKLDFNAIAQGLSVDVLCEFLDQQGFENYYVEIGGELRVKGHNKEGVPWRIGIDLADENNDISTENRSLSAIISISNRAVATSGNYRKFYEKDGKKYSHTIDPKTGYPVQHSLLSATVVADNAAFADAMATVFMVWGTEITIVFVEAHPELKLDVLLQYVDDNGKMRSYYSTGMQALIAE